MNYRMKFPKTINYVTLKRKFLYIFILLFGFIFSGIAQDNYLHLQIDKDGLPVVPPKSIQEQHSVYDYAGLLPEQKRRLLEQKLKKYFDSTSTQIVVATVNKVNDDISLYATEWAHKWGIGGKEHDNGAFLLVSKDNRKITIRTGYGVEHRLTDALSRRIIEERIIPYFKKGDYFGGLNAGVDAIIQALQGEYKNTRSNKNNEGIPLWVIILFIIIFIIIFSSANKNSGGGGWRSSSGGPIIFSSGGRSSWGGGSSFGGGSFGGGFSGGFGGGGFGGGGATGSW